MSRFEKLFFKILSGNSDANISFEELRNILLMLGFTERLTGGSHRIFFKEGVREIINIQPKGDKSKPYQEKQIRTIILRAPLKTPYNPSLLEKGMG